MTEAGVGPVDADTVATQPDLQKLLRGTRVVPHERAFSGRVFDVFEGDERVLYIVPDDDGDYIRGEERRYATTVFSLFAVSARVRVADRTWRVGEPFTDVAGIDRCECWGDGEVTTCFRKGSRLRVVFEEPCEDAEREGPSAMKGKPIDRIMWKRELEPPGLLDD